MRTVCSRTNKPLEQALQDALDDNRTLTEAPQQFKPQDGESYIRRTTSRERVHEPDYKTLLQMVRTGPDLLRFFIMLCPHARETFMKGQLPPYPWRIPATNTRYAAHEIENEPNTQRQVDEMAEMPDTGNDSIRNLVFIYTESCLHQLQPQRREMVERIAGSSQTIHPE